MTDNAFLTRLHELIFEADRRIGLRGIHNDYEVIAWRTSAISLLEQRCGSSHPYCMSLQAEPEWKSDHEGRFDSYLRPALAILKSVKADHEAGIRFNAEKEIDPNSPEFTSVLVRVEQLLQELVQILRERR